MLSIRHTNHTNPTSHTKLERDWGRGGPGNEVWVVVVLGQYWGQSWDSLGAVLGQYWGSTETVLRALLRALLRQYWGSTEKVLGQYWGQ